MPVTNESCGQFNFFMWHCDCFLLTSVPYCMSNTSYSVHQTKVSMLTKLSPFKFLFRLWRVCKNKLLIYSDTFRTEFGCIKKYFWTFCTKIDNKKLLINRKIRYNIYYSGKFAFQRTEIDTITLKSWGNLHLKLYAEGEVS